MTRSRKNCLVALTLCCLPALAGCTDTEKQKALANLQTTETALAAANRDLATTRATLVTTQKERDNLQKELQNLQGQSDTQRKQIDRLTANKQAAEAQRDQSQKQVDELTTQAKAAEAQNEQLKKQVASALAAAAQENNGLKTKIAALEKDLTQKTAQIQALQEKMAELQKKPAAEPKPPVKPTT